jgi:hypothetical protein
MWTSRDFRSGQKLTLHAWFDPPNADELTLADDVVAVRLVDDKASREVMHQSKNAKSRDLALILIKVGATNTRRSRWRSISIGSARKKQPRVLPRASAEKGRADSPIPGLMLEPLAPRMVRRPSLRMRL